MKKIKTSQILRRAAEMVDGGTVYLGGACCCWAIVCAAYEAEEMEISATLKASYTNNKTARAARVYLCLFDPDVDASFDYEGTGGLKLRTPGYWWEFGDENKNERVLALLLAAEAAKADGN